MKRKKTILLFTLQLSCVIIYAQQSSVTAGGNASSANGSISYTIGQVAFNYSSSTTGSVNQGVQQPYEFFALGINNYPKINLEMSVYPNPTVGTLNLNINNTSSNNLSFKIFDATGKQILEQKIISNLTSIDIKEQPAANYILSVFDKNQIIKTFKILKNY